MNLNLAFLFVLAFGNNSVSSARKDETKNNLVLRGASNANETRVNESKDQQNHHHHHHHHHHHGHKHDHDHDHEHNHEFSEHRQLQTKSRCGNHEPSSTQREQSKAYVTSWKEKYGSGPKNNINIPVHFHVIRAGSTGALTQTDLTNSLNALNSGFSATGIQFSQAGATYTDNSRWFYAGMTSSAEADFKSSLRQGGATTLNVYFNSGGGALGYATFPWSYSCDESDDGVVVDYTTVPGGSAVSYNEGDTLTHEVGHWLGLEHVFAGGSCFGEGDGVDDTPMQSRPTNGCPSSSDSCPFSPGLDSVNNFMDYSDDRCLNSFTAGQITRMAAYWDYRNNPEGCGTDLGLIPAPCFSANVNVHALGKGDVTMKDLEAGDKVLTASGNYQSVYTISHFHHSRPTRYIQIYSETLEYRTTDNGKDHPLELTPMHMIFMYGMKTPIPASDVRVGDILQSMKGAQKVTKLRTIIREGLYSPITTDGTIVVGNDIVASTYTSYTGTSHIEIANWKFASFQTIADMAYTPYRAVCMTISLDLCNQHTELAGVNQIMKAFYHIWSKQNDIVKAMIFVAYFIFFGFIHMISKLLFEFVIIIATFATLFAIGDRSKKPKSIFTKRSSGAKV